MNYHALCFVDMSFGQKSDLKSGVVVDFDQIYNEGTKPAIEGCGLEACVETKSKTGGIIHSAMFARLLLSGFVVADLTLANANVIYELGIRQAAKRFTTVPILANVSTLSDYSISFPCSSFKLKSEQQRDDLRRRELCRF